MSLKHEVKRLEQATGINAPCPMCAQSEPTQNTTAPIHGICPICNASVVYDGEKLSEREREVFSEIAVLLGPSALTDRRRCAMCCWWQRRHVVQEADERETRMLQALAPIDPTARQRLSWKESCNQHARAQWDSYFAVATDDELKTIVEIGDMSDAELEAIIWPEPIAA